MNTIRVLHVLDKIHLNSGVSAVVMNYYKNIDKNKVVFDFLVHEEVDAIIRQEIENTGSRIFVMPPFSIKNTFAYLRMLKEFFEENQYLIVHGHIPNAALFYLRSARNANVPIRIIHSHSSKGSDIFWKNIRNVIMTKLGVRYANVYFACSKNAAQYMFGNTPEEVHYLNNAIDIDKYKFSREIREKCRKQLRIDDEIILGHVGRFSEEKNHLFLVELLAELLKYSKKYKLLLLGDGHLKKDIEKRASDLNIVDNIIYTGVVNNVEDYLNAMDVFLLPSFFEGFPVVAVEAQCNGIKCILSDRVTKDTEMIPNIEYLPIEDAQLWVESILKNEVERIADADKRILEAGFSIEKESKKLQDLYESFL